VPYVYHYATELAKSHKHLMAIVPKELDKLGFKISSKPNQWEKYAYNDMAIVVATAMVVDRRGRAGCGSRRRHLDVDRAALEQP